MKVYRAPLSEADLAEISARFRAGQILLIPTDTVYGVAALPERRDALARIIEAKGRDPKKPVQLLAESTEAIARAGYALSDSARRLAEAFWPGALTLVLEHPLRPGETEGFRVADDAVTRALCRAAGGLLRCTSANRSGEKAAADAETAAAQLPEADALIDAGPCSLSGGLASSVVRFSETGELLLLREEAISRKALMDALSDGWPQGAL